VVVVFDGVVVSVEVVVVVVGAVTVMVTSYPSVPSVALSTYRPAGNGSRTATSRRIPCVPGGCG